MIKLTQKNLLEFITSYFESHGLGKEAKSFFTSIRFSNGIVLNLPAVCIVQKNKPSSSKSKQSHIHVTGDNRMFFYDSSYINSLTSSSDDIKRNVTVSESNIKWLNGNNDKSITSLDLKDSFTMTKVAFRRKQDIQVQVSKTRLDGIDFMNLRNSLYTNDLLIFLKYRSQSENHEYFVIGIPFSFYNGSYDIETEIINHLEDKSTITVKNAIKKIDNSISGDAIINDNDSIADDVYQQMVDICDEDYDLEEPTYKPEVYESTNSKRNNFSNRPSTNPKLGKEAIRRNNYKCIFSGDSGNHETFLKENGKPYMEVHHIIPIKYQVNYINKLDTPANLAPVCPLCHRKLHYGQKEEVSRMLKYLYHDRSNLLAESGIKITEDDLIDCY